MSTWEEVRAAAPSLAEAVESRFSAQRHVLLATLRRDGSPRISGTEVQFTAGALWTGSMTDARKAADLQRDPRFALHSAPDFELAEGDAKASGRAEEVTDEGVIAMWADSLGQPPPGPFHLFRLDVEEISLVRVQGDLLVIEWWREGAGVTRIERT